MTAGGKPDPNDPHGGSAAYGVLLLASLTLVWGMNWPFMKIALSEIPVLWFRTACVGFGGAALLLVSFLSRQSVGLPWRQIPALLVTAAFAIVGWHLFTGYGLTLMPAGRAAIIAFLMPVIAALLSSWLLGEDLSANKILALAIGMCGLAVLIGPDLVVFHRAPVGALLMVGAAFAWAMGTVLFKRFNWTSPITTVVGWQLLAGLVPIGLCAALLEPIPNPSGLSAQAWAAATYVFLVPMVFGQWAYYRVVKMLPASIAAINTLLIPVVGVFSSAWLLGEPVGLREIVALSLICAALSAVLIVPARRTET